MKNSFAAFVLFTSLFMAPSQASVDVFPPAYPAQIVRIHVVPGQYVNMGQALFTHEYMKMQDVVVASASGYLGEFKLNLGDVVEPGLGGLASIYQKDPRDPEPSVDGGYAGMDVIQNAFASELDVVPDQDAGISAYAQQEPIMPLAEDSSVLEESHPSPDIVLNEPQPSAAEEVSVPAKSNPLEVAPEVAQPGPVAAQDAASEVPVVPQPLVISVVEPQPLVAEEVLVPLASNPLMVSPEIAHPGPVAHQEVLPEMPGVPEPHAISVVEPQSPGVEEVVSPNEVSKIQVDGSRVSLKPYLPVRRSVPLGSFQWLSMFLDLQGKLDLVDICKPTVSPIVLMYVNQWAELRLSSSINSHHKLWVNCIISSTTKAPFIELVTNRVQDTTKHRNTNSEIEETLSRGGLRAVAMDSIMPDINSYAALLLIKYALLWILLSWAAQMYLAQPHYAYLKRRYDLIVKRPNQTTLVCDHL